MRLPWISFSQPCAWWDEYSKAFSFRVCFSLHTLPALSVLRYRCAILKARFERAVCFVFGHDMIGETCNRCLMPLWKLEYDGDE